MLEDFECVNCKPVSIPLPPVTVLTKRMAPFDEGEKEPMNSVPYSQLVVYILHLSNTTRTGLAFMAGYLSRFMSNHEFGNLKAARNVPRYLQGTKTLGILYERHKCNRDIELLGFSDSYFAADVDNKKSTVGRCFLFGGAVVSWKIKMQEVLAQSTVEAEYIALSFAVCEVLWLMILEVGVSMKKIPIDVGCDNQGALESESDEIENERSKHIDVKHHFIRDIYQKGKITLNYVPTSEMIADIMTKNLPHILHIKFLKMSNMKM